MQRDARGRMLTEGRRLFCMAIQRLTSTELRRLLRVSKQAISDLSSGHRRPSLDLAILMEAELGIPCKAWGPLR